MKFCFVAQAAILGASVSTGQARRLAEFGASMSMSSEDIVQLASSGESAAFGHGETTASTTSAKASKPSTGNAGKQYSGKGGKNSCYGAAAKVLKENGLTNGGAPRPRYSCTQALVDRRGQTGGNVTVDMKGGLPAEFQPYTKPLKTANMCAVNVHWHLGAEHISAGEYDVPPSSPTKTLPSSGITIDRGLQCDTTGLSSQQKASYTWEHCVDMEVGETYEFHWPHSALGACGTDDQYQTPFANGVFCNADTLDPPFILPANPAPAVGVQTQVFVIVNDEDHTYTDYDLIDGMIVDEAKSMGQEMTAYTGSTTGQKFGHEILSNKPCDDLSGITWQVDRKCHLLSASTMDNLCAAIKTKPHMKGADGTYNATVSPEGSRGIVVKELVHDNQQYFNNGL